MSEARPTIAVTGATGFIGRHLAAHLVAHGATVRSIVRPDSPRSAPAGTSSVRAPLEVEALVPAFAGASVVVHLAGVVEST
jgi:nucleoside-diphosphate-sugar epimerase